MLTLKNAWPKQRFKLVLLVLVIALGTAFTSQAQGITAGISDEQLYNKAINAYNGQDWMNAAILFSAYLDRDPAALKNNAARRENVAALFNHAQDQLKYALSISNDYYPKLRSQMSQCIAAIPNEPGTRSSQSVPPKPPSPGPAPTPISTSSGNSSTAPPGGGSSEISSCYVVVYEDGDWEAANNTAKSMGGHLVAISSASENSTVYNLIKDDSLWYVDPYDNGIGPWTGGLQTTGASEPDGGWHWVTNDPFVYWSWAQGEPNNAGGDENRVSFFGSGVQKAPTWNDMPHTASTRGFIVEFEGQNKCNAIRAGGSACNGGEGVYLYQDWYYTGACIKLTSDSSNPRAWAIGNDSASSIRIVGRWTATLCEHDDYQGRCSTFQSSDPDFGNDGIGNDSASSIRVRPR